MNSVNISADCSDDEIAGWIASQLKTKLDASTAPLAIALPGGSTPFPILALLVKHDLAWERIIAYPTDDRLVAEDHPASNTGKLRDLLEPAGAKVQALQLDARPPRFGLVWLGMGADGHVASLFPNTDPQVDDPAPIRRLTPDPLPPEAPFDRITLTFPALLACDGLMLVIRGDDKRAVLENALGGDNDLPITRLMRTRGQIPITCFV